MAGRASAQRFAKSLSIAVRQGELQEREVLWHTASWADGQIQQRSAIRNPANYQHPGHDAWLGVESRTRPGSFHHQPFVVHGQSVWVYQWLKISYWQNMEMLDLARLVQDFAAAVRLADSRGPQATGSRGGRIYQQGIGPHTESQTIKLVVGELVMIDDAYSAHALDVPYPGSPRNRCDWCLGSEPIWDWAIEAKPLRLFGDNGKLNDNMLMHVLSPYPEHRSALTDCEKLVSFRPAARRAILICGYDYDRWSMDPAVEAFETLAAAHVQLGSRREAGFGQLVHPVHQRGRVFAWEVGGK